VPNWSSFPPAVAACASSRLTHCRSMTFDCGGRRPQRSSKRLICAARL
jgi:hypothetical protein